jgi:hypothetical protein
MEEVKRGPGRPRKQQPIDPAVAEASTKIEKAAKKYPRNPDPDILRIINLVKDAISHDKDPIGGSDYLGAVYAERYGYYRHAMKLIAEELGVAE